MTHYRSVGSATRITSSKTAGCLADQDSLLYSSSSAASEAMETNSGSSSTRPVSIPEPKVLPYSRLSLRAHSANSISPSQRILTSGSPGQDCTLAPQQPLQGSGLQPLNPTQPLGAPYPRSRPGDTLGLQPNKRPPLPPSPQAGRAPGAPGSLNPFTSAWINPGEGSASGSGSRQPRLLSAAVTSSYMEPGLLSSAVGSSSGSTSLRQYSYLQQQQYGQYAGSTGSAQSASPGTEGLLAAAVSSEDVATAVGNPYHPQHDSAMQLLLDHQTQQLQSLQQQQQQQRDQMSLGGGVVRGSGYVRGSSFGSMGLSPRSPRMSPRAPSRSGSYNRLSELGTSPGLIEASFMGMAARVSQHSNARGSASLQQMMQQQQAAIRAQQDKQQRSLQHSRSTVSFGEWTGSQQGSGPLSLPESRAGSRPMSAGGPHLSGSLGRQQTLDWDTVVQQQQQQQLHGGVGLQAMGSSLPRAAGDGRGMRALPGRPGLHWLSRADDGESAARGLLGLPRPGIRPGSSSNVRGLQYQQRQQQQQRMTEQQQQDSTADSSCAGEADEVCLRIPAAAADQATPQRIQYDPAVLASYSTAVGAANGLQRAGSSSGSPMASGSRSLFSSRSFGRQTSASSKERAQSGGPDLLRSMSRSGSYIGMPTCLICLDQLTPEDFESGEAMYLACRCKGEVAVRHRQCAEKWTQIKGNTICDVCKTPILNLPEVPPLPAPPAPPGLDDRLLFQGTGLWGPLGDEPPAVADHVFDCIRVTWVVLIVCILFFEMNVAQAFMIAAVVGSAYVVLSAGLASCRRLRRQRRLQRQEGDGAWHDGMHAPLLGGGGRGHLLPV